VDVAVPSEAHLAAVVRSAAVAGAPARVHLHLDCGMARDGAPPTQWTRLCHRARAAQRTGTIQVVGLMGHLACADEPAHPANVTGRARFGWGVMVARSLGLDPRWRHLAATSAALTDPSAHHSLCRVGAGLVGIDPTGTTRLRPALTLRAPVVAVRDVRAGTSVGYGHTWTAPRDTRLVTLPVGYADGIPRAATGRAEVSLLGRRCPLVGRISMDQVVVDVGGLAAGLGDSAVVWGAGGPSVAQWAAWCGTIEHEIVTGVGARVRRRVGAPAAGSPR
jgi:alanine racemase